jgi:alkylated DNA repair protein alkB family protein 1
MLLYTSILNSLVRDGNPVHGRGADEDQGLQILSGLLPSEIQVLFTSQILHRELADERHKNNIMMDYNIPYPGLRQRPIADIEDEKHYQLQDDFKSFFTYPQNANTGADLIPKTPDSSKALNMAQFLTSKLRWLTIGDQYDWPTRSYTRNGPSPFPPDLAKLVQGLFPHIRPESGVVLLYSGKDYMPVHRDVSEECQTALASFSLGCDGIFIIAKGEDDGESEKAPKTVAVRVRSGDCIHLDGETRWAWHAMARTVVGTCPEFLAQWPKDTPGATGQERKAYEKWKGYMSGKRLNISCRQVWN